MSDPSQHIIQPRSSAAGLLQAPSLHSNGINHSGTEHTRCCNQLGALVACGAQYESTQLPVHSCFAISPATPLRTSLSSDIYCARRVPTAGEGDATSRSDLLPPGDLQEMLDALRPRVVSFGERMDGLMETQGMNVGTQLALPASTKPATSTEQVAATPERASAEQHVAAPRPATPSNAAWAAPAPAMPIKGSAAGDAAQARRMTAARRCGSWRPSLVDQDALGVDSPACAGA
jgi:hypothetical protein